MEPKRLATEERDPRVYFATERTYLAWIRTGLALMGFGFVVARFGIFLRELRLDTGALIPSRGLSPWAGIMLVLLGVVVNVVSTIRYVQLIRNLNSGRDVTGRPSRTGIAVAMVLALIGLALAVYLMVMP
jgi:putative membrane protein